MLFVRCRRYIKGILVLLSVAPSLCIQAQGAGEVINKYIEFIGGEKSWTAVKTIISSGEYNYGGVAFPFKAYNKAPDRYKFVVTFKGKYYAQGFDGKTGWKIDVFNGETSPTLLHDKAAIAMANEADVELEGALINYKEKGHHASMEGTDTVMGRTCYKIKLVLGSGETEIYYFDEKNFELVMKRAIAKNPELSGASLQILYSDYRSVSNIKIPFKTVAKTEDQTLLTISIAKAEINQPIADPEFQFNPQTNQ